MKAILVTLLTALCFTLLLLGNFYWDKKTTISIRSSVNTSEEFKQDTGTEKVNDTELEVLQLSMGNWPQESRDSFIKAYNENKTFNIVIVGSSVNQWADIVSTDINSLFGKTIEITELSYDLTSSEFINEGKIDDIIKVNPDLVLFEPFTLKDNGVVPIEDSLSNLETVISTVKESKANIDFILQPPHPLYNAKFYPVQVQELKAYAESNQILYIDHWSSWPDPNTEDILPYLTEDRSEPSDQGYEIWAKAVSDFLISKD